MPTPRDRTIVANRLRHHLLDWGGEGPTVLLLHGFLEHAHAWDLVAPRLVDAGLRVLALDWRGHGDSEWIGAGGYYHFADYHADLAFLIRALETDVVLVGHSMGAVAAIGYTGMEPERVRALVAVDALGPPDSDPAHTPERFAAWIADLERVGSRDGEKRFTLDDATERLQRNFARFTPAVARHMAVHGTREVDGGRTWKFDPLHQTRSPQPYYAAQARAFWERVRCPMLYVEGGDSPLVFDSPERRERLAVLRARRVVMDGVAHHPHLEAPDALADLLRGFLFDAGVLPG